VSVAPLHVQEFYNRREHEVTRGFSRSMREHYGVLSRDQVLTVDKNRFYASDLYNLVFRPIGYDDFLRMVARRRSGDRECTRVAEPERRAFSP